MRFSSVLAPLANVFQIPIKAAASRTVAPMKSQQRLLSSIPTRTSALVSRRPQAPAIQQQCRSFSQSTSRQARKKGQNKPDKRVTLIRYFMYHPSTLLPRPLRLSRTRFLRHWTIHRAWHLHLSKVRKDRELELERQWNSMRAACEELRVGAGDGGRLFRKSMIKKGLWKNGYIPAEYGRGAGGEWIGGLGVRLGEKAEDGSGRVEGGIWDNSWTRS